MNCKKCLTIYNLLVITVSILLLFISAGLSKSYADINSVIQIPPEMRITSSPNPVGSGARALGMGGAFIPVADDATAASWNPGGLIQLKKPEISIVGSFLSKRKSYDTSSVTGEFDDQSDENFCLNYLSFAYPFVFHSRIMVFSLNYQHLYEFSEERIVNYSISEVIVLDPILNIKSELLIKSSSYEKQEGFLGPISPALAVQIIPSLSFGVAANFWIKDFPNNSWESTKIVIDDKVVLGGEVDRGISTSYERYDFSGFNMNLGFLWRINSIFKLGGVFKTPFKGRVTHKLRYFKSMSYPGYETTEKYRLKMPMSYGVGASAGFLDNYLLFSLDIYRTEWDDFIEYSPNGEYSPITNMSVEESNIKETTQVHFGVEYLWTKGRMIYPFRAGVFYDPEPGSGRIDDFYGISIGSGLSFSNYAFDIACQYRFGEKKGAESMQGEKISVKEKQYSIYSSVIMYF